MVVNYTNNTSNRAMIAAIFQDTTASALAAAYGNSDGTYSDGGCLSFTHYMTSGTTSETTSKVRIGPNNTATITFNGDGGSRRFGGVMASSITITEVQV